MLELFTAKLDVFLRFRATSSCEFLLNQLGFATTLTENPCRFENVLRPNRFTSSLLQIRSTLSINSAICFDKNIVGDTFPVFLTSSFMGDKILLYDIFFSVRTRANLLRGVKPSYDNKWLHLSWQLSDDIF